MLYTTNGAHGATSAIYVLNTRTGRDIAVRGIAPGAAWAAIGFAGANAIVVRGGPSGSVQGHDLLLSADAPDISAPLVSAPATSTTPAAGAGFLVEYSPSRDATVVYPIHGMPYTISQGMLQPVHGGAGFVVRSGCNGFVMYPRLGARGLAVAAPAASPFTDLANATHRSAIVDESVTCVWKGFPDGTFRPDAPLTRAELAAILTRVGHLAPPAGRDCQLVDVSPSAWAHQDECAVVADGLMGVGGLSGTPGTFGPQDAPVTMQDFAVAVARSRKWVPAKGGAPAAVQALKAHGVWIGTTSSRHTVSRAEAADC